MRIVDEIAHATGWLAEERMARTSHALEVDGRVWHETFEPEADRAQPSADRQPEREGAAGIERQRSPIGEAGPS